MMMRINKKSREKQQIDQLDKQISDLTDVIEAKDSEIFKLRERLASRMYMIDSLENELECCSKAYNILEQSKDKLFSLALDDIISKCQEASFQLDESEDYFVELNNVISAIYAAKEKYS